MTTRGAGAGLACLAGALLTLGGCATGPLDRTITRGQAETKRFHVRTDVLLPPSDDAMGCGTQAIGAAAARLLPEADGAEVAASLPFGEEGGTPVDVLLGARAVGLDARIERGDWERLLDLAEEAQTVALLLFDVTVEGQTLFGPVRARESFHWSVLSGAAADGSAILLATTKGRHHLVERSLFERRWAAADNCLITLRAPESPTSKGEGSSASSR